MEISRAKIENQLYQLCVFSIVLFHLGDILRKAAFYFELSFTRYTLITKIIVFSVFILYFLWNYKYFNQQPSNLFFIKVSAYLMASFFLGCFFLNSERSYLDLVWSNVEFLFRYLSFPLTCLIFFDFFKKSKDMSKIFFLLEFFFMLNIILILFGFLYDISLFNTYGENRFGYSGLFNRANQVSYLFILFICYYYLIKKKKNFSFKLFFTVVVSLIVGTKKIYLFLILLFVYSFFKFKYYYKRGFYIILTSMMLVFFLFFKEIELILYEQFEGLIKIYQEKGMLTSLLSYRDERLIEAYKMAFENGWTSLNYIFGGPNFGIIRSELGFVDIFLFFGITGLLIYAIMLKYFSRVYLLSNFYLNEFLFVILGIAFLSSGFFIDPYVPLILLILFSRMVNMSTNNLNS